MNLLEELNQKIKNRPKEKRILVRVEAIYLKGGNRYKRTVMVESDEELATVTSDFRKRFKDLIEIRSNGALIKISDEGIPYIDWEDGSINPDPASNQ